MAYVYLTENLRDSNFALTVVRQSVTYGKSYRNSGSNPHASEYLADILTFGTNLAALLQQATTSEDVTFTAGTFSVVMRKRSDNDVSVTFKTGSTTIYGPTFMGTNVQVWNFIGLVIGIDGTKANLYYMGNTGGEVRDDNNNFRGYFWYFPVFSNALPDSAQESIFAAINGLIPKPDPYLPGGTSTTGGGGGSFDDSSDTISLPSVPALNLTLSGMLNAYHISVTDLNDLASWIWGNYDKTDSTKVLSKVFANPTDAILALFMLPFTPGYSSAIQVTVGGYAAGSLQFSPLNQQFYDLDCGTVTISEYWGNYLDYNPYTRITLFLPGVGEVQLDPDEVMGKTVGVTYRVDCLTGQFVCFVHGDNKVFSQYQGCCALQVPVSSADYSRLNSAILQAAQTAAGFAVGVATGGASMGTMMQGVSNMASAALNVLNSKVNHSHSGSLTGAAFFMGSQKPYLLIHRARQSVPEHANRYYGYPSNVTAVLGSLSGFTTVKDIVLDGFPLTRDELEKLRGILSAGIYI